MVGDNIEADIRHKEDYYSFEEMVYTSTTNAIIGGLFSVFPNIIKSTGVDDIAKVVNWKTVGEALKRTGIKSVNDLFGNTSTAIITTVFDKLPNTHIWD